MKRLDVFALVLILVAGLALRLYHLHNPILDHPAWRQGDEAAIARNFAQLHNNILYPQTDYDGPPPNYVELELQIVPFAAAQLYKVFGVHEVFARLIVIAFSLATIVLIYALGAALYNRRAGLLAALLFAIAPGAVYYGRAILPESDMLFFSVAALLAWWRYLERGTIMDVCLATICAALAFLAKPPAIVIVIPMLAAWFARRQDDKTLRFEAIWPPLAMLVLSVLPLWLYVRHLHSIAEWHWATGITSKHVVPTLLDELASPAHFLAGLQSTLALLKMLATTILGPVLFALVLVAMITQPKEPSGRTRLAFFGAWAAALVLYTFAIVNVERVDYYLMPFVPWAVLYAAGGLDNLLSLSKPGPWLARTKLALAGGVFIAIYINMLFIHPYYTWSRAVYAAANEVRRTLEPGTLIVMGHYDPSVLYTIGHRGWEEDPALWTIRDMQSAMRKGARYFVAVEVPRLHSNAQLYAFLQHYARVPVHSGWQVYDLQILMPHAHQQRSRRSGVSGNR